MSRQAPHKTSLHSRILNFQGIVHVAIINNKGAETGGMANEDHLKNNAFLTTSN